MIKYATLFIFILTLGITINSVSVWAACPPPCKLPALCPCAGGCSSFVSSCGDACSSCSSSQETLTSNHFQTEMDQHQQWVLDIFWNDRIEDDNAGVLSAIGLMAEQLTANSIQRTEIIGTFFDAKHQLETQRLFQTLTARAHKDYHPSEELCTIGTATRSLAASERNSNLVATAVSKRSIDRQLLSKDTLTMNGGDETDQRSRLLQFIVNYCNASDNGTQLGLLCSRRTAPPETRNKDIDYTATIDLPLTLDIDLADTEVSDDERAINALTANLISHETMPRVSSPKFMATDNVTPAYGPAAVAYLDSRALVAKRSVAANSLAAITSLKAAGTPESQPFIYAIIKELSPDLFTADNIAELIGENPSYYAQMEVLTKKLYQHPKFYAELYDKPANVLRKDVAIQAADLMQKRDIFRSLLRSEITLATMLETALLSEQEAIKNELGSGVQGVK